MKKIENTDPEAYRELYREIFDIRVRLTSKVRDWGDHTITSLLGYTNWHTMDESHIEMLRKLNGPHGYAIYKMLVARHGHS